VVKNKGMKSSDIRLTSVHKDCPFTREQILEFKAMLYNVNTSNHCCNPSFISWAVGFQQHEQLTRLAASKDAYKEWLENELRNINDTV
jgi:hypothetical protein